MKKENKKKIKESADVTSEVNSKEFDSVMRKYDRESNTRIWEGKPKVIVNSLMVAFSVYSIYVTLFSTAMREERLTIFLGMIIIIGYLNFPAKKGAKLKINHIPWYDIVVMVAGTIPFFYFAFNAEKILKMSTRVTENPIMVIIAIVGMLVLIDLCRRCVGIPILCVVGALLIYTFMTVRPQKVIYDLFYTTSGVMNTPIDVAAKYIVVFIIFGAFLERTGISKYFINLANSIAGAAAGGPAKVAVISSALCGMVSGSSVGNTVTTGSVTIPMMKKAGYKGEFAGAVEASASTGGQVMPPLMGAAAFIMAEYLGVSYATVASRAILPALLYFIGIYIAVHLEARKLNLQGIPKEALPRKMEMLKKAYLLAPIVVLVVLVSGNIYTMQFSAAIAIILTMFIGFFNREEKFTLKKVFEALEAGARGTITVAAACAMAGIVAGCITATGLASQLITAIVSVAGGQAMIALALTMVCCIILGMGVPTTANYCIMAATCAPILMNDAIGIEAIAAHFFVFYFGIVADITPPVALAAYAGSAIAKAPPMKTAVNATKIAIAAFIVPYVFAMNPAMLFVDTVWYEVILICITSIMGIFGVAVGINGYLYTHIAPLFRLVAIAGGLTLLVPGISTDIIGVVLVGIVVIVQKIKSKNKNESTML